MRSCNKLKISNVPKTSFNRSGGYAEEIRKKISLFFIFQKKAIVYNLVNKIIFLSNPRFHEKNFKETINALLDNCYPLPFVFSTIRSRLKSLFYNKKPNSSISETKETRFTFPWNLYPKVSYLSLTNVI